MSCLYLKRWSLLEFQQCHVQRGELRADREIDDRLIGSCHLLPLQRDGLHLDLPAASTSSAAQR